MSRNANAVKSGTKEFVQAPMLDAGSYPARVVQVVFVGVQKQRPYMGQVKDPIDEVRITYELSHEFMPNDDGTPNESKPRWFSESIPFYNLRADRAKSTKRYNAIDPLATTDGDFGKLLGLPCSLLIVKNPGKGVHEGKIFNNIGDVTPAASMPGYKQPQLINPSFYYDPHDFDCTLDQFRGLPEFVQDIIKKADDFGTSNVCQLLNGGQTADDAPTDQPVPTPSTAKANPFAA